MDVGQNSSVKDGSGVNGQLLVDLKRSEMLRKQLLKSLSSVQSRLNTIMRAVSDIVYMLDENGLITFVNDGVERIGFSPTDLIGVNIFDLVHPEDRDNAAFRLNERRRGDRGTQSYDVRFVPNGNIVRSGGEKGEASRVLSITAEGQYSYGDDESLQFIGTFGIARDTFTPGRKGVLDNPDPEKSESVFDGAFIPVCANCKNVRNKKGVWETIEEYFHRKIGVKFTHSICPECTQKLFPDIDKDNSPS